MSDVKSSKNKFAIKMLIAMVLGIGIGLIFMLIREKIGEDSSAWQMIDKILFRDITDPNNKGAIGIFYIIGQLFIRCLKLIIVPMIFCSVVLAIGSITDAATLGRVSAKTLGMFLFSSFFGLALSGTAGMIMYKSGLFRIDLGGIITTEAEEFIGENPLNIFMNIVPDNIWSVFSSNTSVLAVIFLAIVCGLCKNKLKLGKDSTLHKLCDEISHIVVAFLTFVINKFGPLCIFVLLCRTCATYGITYLKPALSYMGAVIVVLLIYMFVAYPILMFAFTRLNPFTFLKKTLKIMLFAFSTSSSAATLPLNMETATDELGVDPQVASFVLPLGMTVNMNGSAMMLVISTMFLAGVGGYQVTISKLLLIMVLALITSIGTPATPGGGIVVLFTILSSLGFTGEAALMGYALLIAINRPIDMLDTSLNCVGDTLTSVIVAKSEGKLDEQIYKS